MTSTTVITILLAITNVDAGYILLRFSSDYYMLDWFINFLAILSTFNARLLCPCVDFGSQAASSTPHKSAEVKLTESVGTRSSAALRGNSGRLNRLSSPRRY
uniref:Uncharacterized protein n=1 Tax=Lotharella globosa TaxID=91324 RepID=A0A6V3J5T9_9EUKA|mmetsp:Transcript_23605/g.46005  ORF Transcript_23605/g.46005 Transcript_23605/m.46005 type:complete len:102 (+) Transcript_23605:448-753(+)